ncbi:MAG: leucyl aminopeptidase [Micavibrio sp.]|nr:leucyl aminopeptidase [Micavibrio sp.]
MPKTFLTAPAAFTATAGKNAVTLQVLTRTGFEAWVKKAPAQVKQRIEQSPFGAKPGQIMSLYNDKGALTTILIGINDPVQLFDLSPACDYVIRSLTDKTIKSTTFKLEGLKGKDAEKACIGWGLAAYRFEDYKTEKSATLVPKLAWPEKVDKKSVEAHLESACLIRNLINIPANDLGPDELEKAARTFATAEGLTIKVTKDKDLIKNNFPMIYEVGKGSPRRPRLIDMQWGNAKHKKLTLVGKGVCFDTGGLNLKPGGAMYTMKKDMGGAAHVLGLAMLIIRHKLPVRLRVLIPAVENSVSGESYRPADVINSRKGLTVEVGDTDAEGRLVLADALTLASEEKPDFLIDFATLTGAARVATGMDMAAVFSNDVKIAFSLKDYGDAAQDYMWPLPLHQAYRKDIASNIADLCSTGGKAGATTAALFLETFVDAKTDWVHVDLSAWEEGSRPGRSKGGTEMGSRAVFAYLQDRFR